MQSQEFQRTVYETLATRSFPDPDKFLPLLAERWEFDGGGWISRSISATASAGIRSNCPRRLLPPREMTARDVSFSLDCMMNKHVEAASIRNYFEDPDAPDARQGSSDRGRSLHGQNPLDEALLLTRKSGRSASRSFPSTSSRSTRPASRSRATIASKEFAEGFNNHWASRVMCGTGPMMFREWTRNQQLVLERNPDYWGRPYFFSRSSSAASRTPTR